MTRSRAKSKARRVSKRATSRSRSPSPAADDGGDGHNELEAAELNLKGSSDQKSEEPTPTLLIPKGHELRTRSDQGWLVETFRQANTKWYEPMLDVIERVNRAADNGLYEVPIECSNSDFGTWLKERCSAFGWDYHYFDQKLVIEWRSAKNAAASPLEKIVESVQQLDMSLLLVHDVLMRATAAADK